MQGEIRGCEWRRHPIIGCQFPFPPFSAQPSQKNFIPKLHWREKHQAKLAAVIKSARRSKCSLAIVWLDIDNAYGSFHQKLCRKEANAVKRDATATSRVLYRSSLTTVLPPRQVRIFHLGQPLSTILRGTTQLPTSSSPHLGCHCPVLHSKTVLCKRPQSYMRSWPRWSRDQLRSS